MTRDVAAQAVHERLEHLVTTMPDPDVEAGWAALVAQLEPPVAPIVRLHRRRRPRRAIVLGVAAAILIGGSALAMVRQGSGDTDHQPTSTGSTSQGPVGSEPHGHVLFSGSPPVDRPTPRSGGGGHDGGSGGPSGGSAPSTGASGDTSSGDSSGGDDPTQSSDHDSPSPGTGTGSDGTNDTGGQGDNSQGQDSQGD